MDGMSYWDVIAPPQLSDRKSTIGDATRQPKEEGPVTKKPITCSNFEQALNFKAYDVSLNLVVDVRDLKRRPCVCIFLL